MLQNLHFTWIGKLPYFCMTGNNSPPKSGGVHRNRDHPFVWLKFFRLKLAWGDTPVFCLYSSAAMRISHGKEGVLVYIQIVFSYLFNNKVPHVGPVCFWLVWSRRCCLTGSKMCTEIFVSDIAPSIFAEIPMIFCTHVYWVVPECSAKFGPKCSRFHEMAAIIYKKITLLHFFLSPYQLFQRNLIGTLLGLKGTLCANLTLHDLDLGKWQPFLWSEIRFCALFFQICFGYSSETL